MDLILFPIDTVKTRLQSAKGFRASGGFKGIYSGLPSTLVGTAPTSALFFTTYDTVKSKLNLKSDTLNQIIAANTGEVVGLSNLNRLNSSVNRSVVTNGHFSSLRAPFVFPLM